MYNRPEFVPYPVFIDAVHGFLELARDAEAYEAKARELRDYIRDASVLKEKVDADLNALTKAQAKFDADRASMDSDHEQRAAQYETLAQAQRAEAARLAQQERDLAAAWSEFREREAQLKAREQTLEAARQRIRDAAV
jgi:chromosome segregation ATPase